SPIYSRQIGGIGTSGIVKPALIFDDVGLEDLPVRLPSLTIEAAIRIEAIDRRIRHVQCVVRVVMGEKSLTTEGEETLNAVDPAVELSERNLVALPIDRVSLAETTRDN